MKGVSIPPDKNRKNAPTDMGILMLFVYGIDFSDMLE